MSDVSGIGGVDDCHRMPAEGERIGRFVVLRDLDGVMVAVAAGAVSAVCQTDDGALVALSGGRAVHVGRPLGMILRWLDGRA